VQQGYEEELYDSGIQPGAVFTTSRPGTVALRVLYDRRRGDRITTTSLEAPFLESEDLGAASRSLAGPIEGYVYTEHHPDTVALAVYYNARTHDHLTTARSDLRFAAEEAGYAFEAVVGWVPPH
jgi:hypothetical protein